VIALECSCSGRACSVSGTSGDGCGTAGVSDNRVAGCGSRSGLDDGIRAAASAVGRVARGGKFPVRRCSGGRDSSSTRSTARGFSVAVTGVLVTAGHAFACEVVHCLVTLDFRLHNSMSREGTPEEVIKVWNACTRE
jgi:hypothetical protein